MVLRSAQANDDGVAAADWHRDAVALLVTQAKQGDRHAFAELYQSRLSGVGRYVGAMVRDVHRAEDVVAQTFLLAWRDLPKLRKHDRFDAWLYRIAHNQAITELRRPRTTPIDDAPEPADFDPQASPEQSVDAAQDAEAMRDALRQLPEPQRQVLQLRFFQELTAREVALQMGKTEQSIYALQQRAIANLRQIIGRDATLTVAPAAVGSGKSPARRAA